jgi:hypothetical protein
MVSLTLIVSGEQRRYNTKTSEFQSCEVLWDIHLRILQDPSYSSDHGDVHIMSGERGSPHVERQGCHVSQLCGRAKRC